MSSHFNKLTPAEAERIALLMEECGEVIQICGKILRHGYDSHNPFDENKVTNRELLEKEAGDVQASLDLMIKPMNGDLPDIRQSALSEASKSKKVKLLKYLHHNLPK